jgi:quinolinate synthase
MLRHIDESSAEEFAVGTELGIMHQLNKRYPDKKFHPVNPDAVCAFMKTITLDKVIRSLETLAPQITVPVEIARKAKRSIDRMLELS